MTCCIYLWWAKIAAVDAGPLTKLDTANSTKEYRMRNVSWDRMMQNRKNDVKIKKGGGGFLTVFNATIDLQNELEDRVQPL